MKKYILSFLVLATFAVYVAYQHIVGTNDNASVADIAPPTEVAANDTASIPSGDTGGNNSPITPNQNSTPLDSARGTSLPVSVNTKSPAPIKAPMPVQAPPAKVANTGLYRDGQYTGISADAYYGNIQVQATITGGKLTDVQFLDYPQDRGTSVRINSRAMPYLRQEALQAQSANVNTVSGATDSSGAFRQSLASALAQARNS